MRFRGSWSTFRWLTPLCALALPYVGLALLGLTSGCAKINRPWMDGGADSGIDAVNLDAPDRDSNGMDVLSDRIVDEAGRDSELVDQDLMDSMLVDSTLPDSSVMDSGIDTGTNDSAMDSGAEDTAIPDSGPADSGIADVGLDSGMMSDPPNCGLLLGGGWERRTIPSSGVVTHIVCVPLDGQQRTYSAARSFCVTAGWHLPTINSAEENEAIRSSACGGGFCETTHTVPLRATGGIYYRTGEDDRGFSAYWMFRHVGFPSGTVNALTDYFCGMGRETAATASCRPVVNFNAVQLLPSGEYWNWNRGGPNWEMDGSGVPGDDFVEMCLSPSSPLDGVTSGTWRNAPYQQSAARNFIVVCERQ